MYNIIIVQIVVVREDTRASSVSLTPVFLTEESLSDRLYVSFKVDNPSKVMSAGWTSICCSPSFDSCDGINCVLDCNTSTSGK